MKLNNVDFDTYFNNYPDVNGYFGKYGGAYIEPKLKAAMDEITEAYFSICQSRGYICASSVIAGFSLSKGISGSSWNAAVKVSDAKPYLHSETGRIS